MKALKATLALAVLLGATVAMADEVNPNPCAVTKVSQQKQVFVCMQPDEGGELKTLEVSWTGDTVFLRDSDEIAASDISAGNIVVIVGTETAKGKRYDVKAQRVTIEADESGGGAAN